MKRLRNSGALIELFNPDSLKVNGVGEHKPGEIVKAARRQNALYPALRLLLYPMVNLLAGRPCRSLEIGLVNIGLVFTFSEVQKTGQKWMAFLRPECVGDVQLHPLLFAGLIKPPLKHAESRTDLVLISIKVENRSDFLLRVAPCAGIRHRQRSRNTVRREEHISGTGFELVVTRRAWVSMAGTLQQVGAIAALVLCLVASEGCASLSPRASQEQAETGGGVQVSDDTLAGVGLVGEALYWAGSIWGGGSGNRPDNLGGGVP